MRRSALVIISFFLAGLVPAQRGDLYDLGTLHHFELTFKQLDWWQQLRGNYDTKTYIKADLNFSGRLYRDVGVRFRGNSTYRGLPPGSKKTPFKIKLDAFVPGQDLHGYDTLNLKNNLGDPSFVREVLGLSIFRRYGPAPRANYVTLAINGEDFGPYINIQKINKDLQERNGFSRDGNRYQAERSVAVSNDYSALIWLGNDPAQYQKGFALKTSPDKDSWTDLIRLCDILNNTPIAQLPAKLPAVLDIDVALRMLAVGNGMLWLDSYEGYGCRNYFLHQDALHGRFVLMPWDADSSFGLYPDGLPDVTKVSPFRHQWNWRRPLLSRLLAIPAWRARYCAHIRTFLEEVMDWPRLEVQIRALHALIDRANRKDPKRLYPPSMLKDSLTKSLDLGGTRVPGLKPVVEARRAYLLGRPEFRAAAPQLTNLQHAPAEPDEKATVTVTVRVGSSPAVAEVTLYHRTRGSFAQAPMFDDGRHGDGGSGDGLFGAFLPKVKAGTVVDYYVGAMTPRSSGGAMAFAPATAGFRPPRFRIAYPRRIAPITINELLAKNVTGVKDQAGEREDWIELHNASPSPLDIGGLHLTDDIDRPTKWSFPRQTMASGGTLLVWADEDGKQGPLHANFKLSASSGETVTVFDRDGKTILDQIVFAPQAADISLGRLIDGKDPWVTYDAPSPQMLNAPQRCGTRRYSARPARAHVIDLSLLETPKVGTTVTWKVAGGPARKRLCLMLTASGGYSVFGDLVLLVAPPIIAPVLLATDANGAVAFRIRLPNDSELVGLASYWQVAEFATASNALEVTFCR